MELLQKKGFFGHSLEPVTTALLVKRYNACLRALGKEETALERFSIDGAGWSPQIAKERNDRDYLCHGEANLYAIILTPNQKGKPVYAPMHSFDGAILEALHAANAQAVSNLTSRSAIILDIDQGLDAYDCPLDLLMVDTFTARAFTPDSVMTGALEQKKLVARFRKEDGAWQDAQLVEDLIHSAREFGDLRHNQLQIPPTPFNDLSNFYTRAMRGLYVLRDCLGSAFKIVILASDQPKSASQPSRDIYSLKWDGETLLRRLISARFLEPGKSELLKEDVERLEHIKHLILVQTAYENGLDRDFDSLNSGELASWKQKLRPEMPDAYTEIRKVIKSMRAGELQTYSHLGLDVWVHLLRPNEKLPESTQSVLWHLLVRMQPHNVEMTYRHHKTLFYDRYQTWPKAQRNWALNYLNKLGLPHHE
ncbi:MAG: DUF6638 family protein [Opitutaceae bacterium]